MIDRDAIKHSFWALPIEEVFQILQTTDAGLDDAEVQARQRIFGPNELEQKKRSTRFLIFAGQLKSPLILILLIAGSLTFFLNKYIDAVFIFAAVLVNIILGFYQENKAEEALAHLKSYVRQRAIVTRRGREKEIDSRELVPGDIIHFSQGDRLPADARVVFGNNLLVDQAVLTGESLPVEKSSGPTDFQAQVIDQNSMVFSGSLVSEGIGKGVVVATGRDAFIGRIAETLAKASKEKTPLQKKILDFSLKSSALLVILTIAVFFLGLGFGHNPFEMFIISVAIAVAAVPEGLPIALTVILSLGVERLARKNGVVKKLLAAETLGDTTVILTDKTGTLTEARMALTDIDVNPLNSRKDERELKKTALKLAVINSRVIIENPQDAPELWQMSGRPIEKAIISKAAEYDVLAPLIKPEILDLLPFTSDNKYAAVLFKEKERRFVLGIMGAPEIIIGFAGSFYFDGRLRSLKKDDQEALLNLINKRALSGERTLAIAFRRFSAAPKISLQELGKESGLVFLAAFFFRDPVRPGVGAVIKKTADAGIKTVIVTGDHQGTAEAVAKELGWSIGPENVIDGPELAVLSREGLAERLPRIKIFSRVTPEGKIKIVQAYQQRGEIAAMTGDGVNDAPALKIADIGVALGSGTDVAKEAADLILLDDNFETLIAAVKEGRRIMENIKKIIVFFFSSLLDELILIGSSLAFGLPLPFNALQILWVNFFADSIPAVAFAFEKGFDDFLRRPPSPSRSLFDPRMKFLVLTVGVSTSVLIFILYYLFLAFGFEPALVRTFTFLGFGTYSLFLAFSLRSLEKPIWRYNPLSNFYLLGAVFFGLLLMAAAVYLPFFQKIFQTVAMPPVWLFGAFGFGVFNIAIVELGKWIYKRKS